MEPFQVAFFCSSPSVCRRESGSRADLTLGQNPPSSHLSPNSRSTGGGAADSSCLSPFGRQMVAGGRRKRIPNSGALYHPFGLVTHGEGCWRGTRSRRFRRRTMSGSVRCPTAGLVRTRQRKPPFRAICRAGSVAEDSEHGSDPALLSHRSFAWAATSEAFPGDR